MHFENTIRAAGYLADQRYGFIVRWNLIGFHQ